MGKQKLAYGRSTVLAPGDIWTLEIANAIIEITTENDPIGRINIRSTVQLHHHGVQRTILKLADTPPQA